MTFHPLDVRVPPSQIKPVLLQQIYAFVNHKAKLIVGNADPALDIVTFDPKFANVMQLLFQDWFLCEDEETARKLSTRRNGQNAFNCITLKGD